MHWHCSTENQARYPQCRLERQAHLETIVNSCYSGNLCFANCAYVCLVFRKSPAAPAIGPLNSDALVRGIYIVRKAQKVHGYFEFCHTGQIFPFEYNVRDAVGAARL